MSSSTRRPLLSFVAVLVLVFGSCDQADQKQSGPEGGQPRTARTTLRIGNRAAVTADLGAVWAHEVGAFTGLGVDSEIKSFGPPHALLQDFKAGGVDVVTAAPLEAVLEDIRKGEANYYIYTLQCFSPVDQFDAIVTKRPAGDQTPSWNAISGQALGVIPSRQNILVGRAIVAAVGADMTVRPFNPQNPLLGLESGDFGAIHVLGTDVARAKANSAKFAILEACSASKHVFGGKVTPAGAGLISKKWVQENPAQSKHVIAKIIEFSQKALANPRDAQLVALLRKSKYGGIEPDISIHLAFTPLIAHNKVERKDFEPLMSFLRENSVEAPSVEEIMKHVYVTP